MIKEKSWYGWPDFSGGDPVNSPRFLQIQDEYLRAEMEEKNILFKEVSGITDEKILDDVVAIYEAM